MFSLSFNNINLIFVFILPVITDTQYCLTVHHFGRHGKTKSVTKRCASLEDCNLSGCRHQGNAHHAVRTRTRVFPACVAFRVFKYKKKQKKTNRAYCTYLSCGAFENSSSNSFAVYLMLNFDYRFLTGMCVML